MKKLFLKKSFPISLLIIFISLVSLVSSCKRLPKEAKEVGLENTGLFNKPILIKIIEDIEYSYAIPHLYSNAWTNFLIKEGYLERIVTAKGRKTYEVTNKLRPFIVSEDSSSFWGIRNREWNIKVAKYQLKSINKVEKIIDGDDDLWRFSFTYFVEPLLPGLPTLGPYKGYTGARFNRWKEEWNVISDFSQIFKAFNEIKVESSDAITEYGKWLSLKENSNDKTGN